jgi:hypothetical protein
MPPVPDLVIAPLRRRPALPAGFMVDARRASANGGAASRSQQVPPVEGEWQVVAHRKKWWRFTHPLCHHPPPDVRCQ